MGLIGFAWVYLGSIGYTWFTRVHLSSFGIPLGSFVLNLVHLGSLGFNRAHQGSHGFTSVHLDSLGITLVHLGSFRFTLVHFGKSLDLGCCTLVYLGILESTWFH